ncbi:MAG: hypothetical protein R3A13_06085 [Bdellovibrionota bacterium]
MFDMQYQTRDSSLDEGLQLLNLQNLTPRDFLVELLKLQMLNQNNLQDYLGQIYLNFAYPEF